MSGAGHGKPWADDNPTNTKSKRHISMEDCDSMAEQQGVPDFAAAETINRAMGPARESPGPAGRRPLQRLAQARKQQGMSLRTMARRLRVDVATVVEQEQETADLPLTTIYAWQKILDVPLGDLIEDSDGARLSASVLERARLVKLMKTAAAILENAHSKSLRGMVTAH